MNGGLLSQVLAAKATYRLANPKARHVSVRRITGRQIHEHGGEFCNANGMLRDGSRACLAILDNADVVVDLEYATSADPAKRFYFYWATIGVLNGVASVWAD